MYEFKDILVPVDFSRHSEHAMQYATTLAKNYRGKIHCVHVLRKTFFQDDAHSEIYNQETIIGDEEVIRSVQEKIAERLENIAQDVRSHGVEVECHMPIGRPHKEIIKLAESLHADLIVMGTHGKADSDLFSIGNVYKRTMHESTVPVLAIKHPEHEFIVPESYTMRLKRVLCPCDRSEYSCKAVPLAADICRRFGASLILCHVAHTLEEYEEFMPPHVVKGEAKIDQSTLTLLKDLASKQDGVSTEVRLLKGKPHKELVEIAKTENVDLIVMTSQGHSSLGQYLAGESTNRVVHFASCPVLTFRPQDDIETEAIDVQAARYVSA